jgi:SAM-dependent methyltransferase
MHEVAKAAAGVPRFDPDRVNRRTWQRRGTVATYRNLHGWTDPGEQAAIGSVAARVRGEPILDIGVGAGRTTDLLRPISPLYVGIDYTPEMVTACRIEHPGVRFQQMDARDMASFDAGAFALAAFSFNGIDSVPASDRAKVLAEVHRVLRPGGFFVVSSHNREGPGVHERPALHVPFSPNPLRLGWRVLRSLSSMPRSWANHLRLRTANEDHDTWALRNCGAHDFGLLVVYTTLAQQRRDLAQAGFEVEATFGNLGPHPLREGEDTSGIWWFHHVARKPAPH